MNLFKKRPRLGWKAMVFARLTMQTEKCGQILQSVPKRNLDALPFGLADITARALPEGLEETAFVAFQTEKVDKILGRWRNIAQKNAAATELDVLPTRLPSILCNGIQHLMKNIA